MTRIESAKAAVGTARAALDAAIAGANAARDSLGSARCAVTHMGESWFSRAVAETKKITDAMPVAIDAYARAVADLAVSDLAGEQSVELEKHEEHMREAARRPFAGTVGSRTCAIISAELDRLRARVRELDTPTARPIEEWHEDMGPVLWWKFPVQEAPYSGSETDVDFPDHVTHWTPIQVPAGADEERAK